MISVAADISEMPDFKNEFSRNLISNSSYFLINILIGLLIVPFYIDILGLAAYAIIPLATSFTSYVILVLSSVFGAISRFLTIYIQRSDVPETTRIFNTSLFFTIGAILIFIPVAVVIAWFAPDFFNITELERESVFFLFLLVFFSAFMHACESPFSAVLASLNKIHYINYIKIFRLLMSTGIIVALLVSLTPSVYFIGVAYFCAAFCALLLTITLSRKVYKIQIAFSYFSKKHLEEIASLALWILVEQIGTLLLLNLSLIIVIKILGAESGGEYAIVLVFFTLLWEITGLLTQVLSPMYFTYYARGLFSLVKELSIVSVKGVGLVTALPIALICIFSQQLLTVWVGARFAHLSSLMWIFLVPLTMIVAFRPLVISFAAYNKVRLPAIITIISGILNLILAVLLTSVFGLGEYGIAFAFVFALMVRNVIFVPWYAARIQEVPLASFYSPVVPGVLSYGILVIMGLFLGSLVTVPDSLPIIILISAGISIIYCIIVTQMILTMQERKLIRSILPFGISKKLPRWII